jgi:hypothetical protein
MSQDVVKVIYLARRNPALSASMFPDRWRQHAVLGGSIPSLRGNFVQVAQCLSLYDRAIVPRASLDFDGVNLLTLKDRDVALAMHQDDMVLDIMLPDELLTFSTYVRHFSLQCVEHVVQDGDMLPFCLISFLKRDRHFSTDAFVDATVAALTGAVPGARRTIVNRVEDRPPGYNFDAITESWFASAEEAASATRAASYKAYLRQREALCDESRSVAMMTRITHSWPTISTAAAS